MLITWVRWMKPQGKEFSQAVENALLSGGLVILITAAGGAFGAMLKETNVAMDIKALFEGGSTVGMASLFLAFGCNSSRKVTNSDSGFRFIYVLPPCPT